MDLDRNLLKEFAQITNDSEVKSENKYLRGTIVKTSGNKYVKLDGSTTVTPISEVVDVDEGDRVLVSIENHRATIVGNFTYSPSGRKEQEAIDKAENAQDTANDANNKANAAQEAAQNASEKADTAIDQASLASTAAAEAKEQAQSAQGSASAAQEDIQEAKDLAAQASADATEAKQQAAASQAASAEAQAEVTRIQGDVDAAKEDIDNALADLESQAGEIDTIKETYSTKVEVNNTKAELETTITTKVGELETTVSETYSTKTENVALEGRLQTQITQNAEGLASQVSKTEKLESDTAKAQEDVADALNKAQAAQTTANEAKTKADAAQDAADAASENAQAAADKAVLAQNAADVAQQAADEADAAVQEAQGYLDEAKEDLANMSTRVDATEADIAEAQAKVDQAQADVNEALADAAEANLAATRAQEAADQAQQDAETAQGLANTAQQKADNAKTAADNAQAAANKAQQDVAALTTRVTTAETNIIQNGEKIELNASKTTEIGEKLDNLEIGGRNYFSIKTQTPFDENDEYALDNYQNTGSFKQFYNLTVPMSTFVGKELIFSFEAISPNGEGNMAVYNTNGNPKYLWVNKSSTNFKFYTEWTKTIIKATVREQTDTASITYSEQPSNKIEIYCNNKMGCKIRNVKLEIGNKETDWTPAPEDIENELTANYYKKEETDAKLQVEADRITSTASKVSEVETDLGTYKETVDTKFEQTATDYKFLFNSATEQINNLEGDTNRQFQEIQKYIRFDNGNIILGETGNELILNIQHDRISFIQNNSEVAYFSNNKLNVTDGEFINSLQIGKFAFKPRANGSLSFGKVTS